ncbi:antibiotic biosynthesis monooxygenase [Granulicella sp. WH15]|uniref:antibiotic biosynthesis monooxygenase family protein n=1 Tax=Granulicella sp. WH15 TaxID=2602070 RepID=UPI00136767AB|nr:antibiotic biosynthesis monooxygenase [Granulicella sp. WH15]QHN04894.1 antibiotic biosynthesis monooxygenase [Granulicella sp. WH15]
MVLEIAQLEIKPGTEAAFEAGVRQAEPLFLSSQGCTGFHLKKSVESPLKYRLFVEWATLEDHTVTFRESESFTKWRELVQDYFAVKPDVEHWESIL